MSKDAEVIKGPVADVASGAKRPKMELYLDTSGPVTTVRVNQQEYTWEAGHCLAEQLLAYLRDRLAEQGCTWQDLTKITFYAGPGSFTGLRIGAAVVNTLADQLQIPLYDHHGVCRPVIIPEYGRPANISAPRK